VRSLLREAGIALRSNSEAIHLARKPPDFEVTEALIEIVDGVLLGDGALEGNAVSARLSLSQRHECHEWVSQVRQQLETHGILVSETRQKSGTTTIRGQQFQRKEAKGLRTRNYKWFAEQHARWYPEGIKRIPHDVRLTEVSVAHWWFGDGGVGNKSYHARFSTDGFPWSDVEQLLTKLHVVFGWEGSHTRRNRILLSKAKDRQSLLDLVSPYTPSCFQYKMRLKTGNACRVLTDQQEQELLELRRQNWSYGRLATHYGLSKSGVAAICAKNGLSGYSSRKPKS